MFNVWKKLQFHCFLAEENCILYYKHVVPNIRTLTRKILERLISGIRLPAYIDSVSDLKTTTRLQVGSIALSCFQHVFGKYLSN